MNKLIASIFGIGYLKGGGTYASIVTCVAIYFLWQVPAVLQPLPNVLIGLAILLTGIYTGNKVEPFWGKDSYRVVIDEVAGMWITMLFVPINNIKLLIAGLILFRFFDMVKPLGVRRMEDLKGGLGVMMDDVLAGVYANLVLQLIIFSGLLN
ncbi:phosphatidylglycerophosphatase A [Mucilaginibacter sp. UR6-1]|uniref:phosphatidylglycerophosphatase A family protein n=1 Tax=Mucilaginibacter sp. UR6-1 TaxID=1435643 RepID=UPI001E34FF3B|nr:phosphatidylglycerophosphatase A [Mucilaginibacter sp. UR6-1]MCC8411106.1 phosphatidylglycerophosphatase A [Mucilaginibacter sp. UR6-1]